MGDEDAFIKGTQETLGTLITKPKMTEKYLKKPPFRFLHDIVMEVVKVTGFAQGLFSPEESDAANLADKQAKVDFLNKAINVVCFALGEKVDVVANKVVAGLEADKTNLWLQKLHTAATTCAGDKSAEAVQRVLNGETVAAPKKEKKKKDEEPAPPPPAEAAAAPQEGPTEEEKKAEEKRLRAEKREKEKRRRAEEEAKAAEAAAAAEAPPAPSPPPEAEDPEEEEKRRKKEEERQRRKQKDEDRKRREEKQRQLAEEEEQRRQQEEAEMQRRAAEEAAFAEQQAQQAAAAQQAQQRRQLAESPDAGFAQPPMEPQSGIVSGQGAGPEEIAAAAGEMLAARGAEEDAAAAAAGFARPVPGKLERPRTAGRRPPKVQSKVTTRSDEPGLQSGVAPPAIIAEGTKDDDDEDMFETPQQQNMISVKADDGMQHGKLVRDLLSEKSKEDEKEKERIRKEELETREQVEESGPKGIKMGKLKRKKDSAGSLAEIDVPKLSETIQHLCQAANPLGKSIDLVNQDIHNMGKELDHWKQEYRDATERYQKELKETDEILQPLYQKVAELDDKVAEQKAKIRNSRSRISKNDIKIQSLLQSVVLAK
eukprot:gnl/TRDRNA2_/TRDRNA2_182444_c0_seq1.p1 gnl/TRDRNA2_/TRDRNA2_182444_c0~~gnl/TRDRNA2_/TRDRNA2_182444_c0_seq1.p1  ORF type:complete len:597 (-),score=228.62 gnl/TRDRNA2_/TRDRNA2_182444_c0_seq1:359-2149(-)